ncbi:MAG: tail fiber domain-containing protein [Bacteroidia bacterium]|nr:tail fiber domain-containing protein [Bacteroidia bacterium]
MKRFLFSLTMCLIVVTTFAQVPQTFQYQAVIRDVSGTAMVNQSVNFQISILSGSVTGTAVYVETHTASTNAYGIVALNIGSGIPVTGTLSSINWESASHFIKVEADPTGGTSYLDMGTTQLLSVPYALNSLKANQAVSADNATNANNAAHSVSSDYATVAGTANYVGGTGIDITGSTVTNTSPDQTVTLTQGGATTISGTYPNFTISSTDLNSGTPGGLNKSIQFNNAGVFGGNSNLMWDNSNERLGIGLSNPSGRMVVQGSATALATEPLFEVKNKSGQTVFVVYEDSVNVFVNDDVIQSNRGGFAVSGRNNAKAFTNKYLHVTPDNSKIWTKDTLTGFGIKNIGTSTKTSYMQLTPNNYLIGHETGINITTGKYNSFIGYQAGYLNTVGYNNYFFGYRAGYSNIDGYSNIFIGDSCGFANTSGYWNTANGYKAMKVNTTGWNNTAIGVFALYKNTSGNYNTGVGLDALYSNTTGQSNVAIGFNALLVCNGGNNNTAIGTSAYSSGTFFNSTAIGSNTVITANNQVALGNNSITTFYCMGAYVGTVGVTNRDLFVDNTGKIGYVASSKRYKNSISDMENINWLYDLRPVNYCYNNDDTKRKQYGLIAEEVEKLNPLFVSYNPDGSVETVNYSSFISPMLKALQDQKKKTEELQKINSELQKRIETLENKIK